MHSERMGHLQTRLPEIDKQSETLFLSLGSGFPRLLDELRKNLSASSEYLDRYVDPRNQAGRLSGELNAIWTETRTVLSGASQYFASLAVRDDTVFRALRDGVGRLSTLGEQIQELRRDALDMELLAINAVVTASKAGAAGRGFSYLANELKKLAIGTVEGTERLADDGQGSLDVLRSFQDVVEEMAKFQKQFFGEFDRRLSTGFNDLIDQVGALSGKLRLTVDRAREVEKPLRRIMEEIQIQDIIMQSINHVMLVAKGAQGDENADPGDEIHSSMTQLSAELIWDIRTKLAGSLAVFKESLAALHSILAEIGEAPGPTDGDADADTGTMDSAFDEPLVLLQRITEGISRTNSHRVHLREQGLTITQQMSAVVDQLATLSRSIARLYPIQVLSRIQVAEVPRLDAKRSAIKGIRDFVQKVSTHVGGTLRETSSGLSRMERVIAEYSATSERDIDVAERMSGEILDLTEALNSARSDLTGSMDEFSVFSGRFHELLAQAEEDVNGLDALVAELDQLVEDLGVVDRQSLGSHESAGDAAMETVVGTLVDRFTIARHKSSAASLVGMELQEGSREGELTLF